MLIHASQLRESDTPKVGVVPSPGDNPTTEACDEQRVRVWPTGACVSGFAVFVRGVVMSASGPRWSLLMAALSRPSNIAPLCEGTAGGCATRPGLPHCACSPLCRGPSISQLASPCFVTTAWHSCAYGFQLQPSLPPSQVPMRAPRMSVAPMLCPP